MTWKMLEKGSRSSLDMIVKRSYIYFPRDSKIRNYVKENNVRNYDLWYDLENGEVFFHFYSKGKYKLGLNWQIKNVGNKKHKVYVAVYNVLGEGMFEGEIVNLNGMRGIIFKKDLNTMNTLSHIGKSGKEGGEKNGE